MNCPDNQIISKGYQHCKLIKISRAQWSIVESEWPISALVGSIKVASRVTKTVIPINRFMLKTVNDRSTGNQ